MSLNNQQCQARPKLVNINSNEALFYLLIVGVDKCGENCNNFDDPYVRVCIPNEVNNIIIKVLNLISRVNETRFLV